MNLLERIRNLLADLSDDQRRVLREVRPLEPGIVEIECAEVVDFASNDYLGLSLRPELAEGATKWMMEFGAGSRASRLVSGNLDRLSSLEEKLANLKGTETALIMGSGFQLNASVLSALVDRRLNNGVGAIQVFTDRLNHASFHVGFAAAGSIKQQRFRHNDLSHLQEMLEEKTKPGDAILIATESVFSMDGDRLDVDRIRELSQQHSALLYVDEAHATGLYGDSGMGLMAGDEGCGDEIIMGTFGKAMGCYGAYLACSQTVREYLVNRCAGLIYSTALPPMVLGAIGAALDLVPTLNSERQHLQELSIRLRSQLKAAGFDTLDSDTQIVPLVVQQDGRTMEFAAELLKRGFLVAAIRPPTVPVGTSRLRISLSAAHTFEQVDALVSAIRELMPTGVS